MKIIVIGASGTVGKAVAAELAQRHDIIAVGSNSGAYQADISDIAQVRALFARTGKVDAVVVAAGKVHFGALADFTPEQFQIGLNSKLMGQVNVALVAQEHLNDGGSITLTSGIIADEPIRFGASASMVNAAVEGFARGAAIELTRGLRINVVSPTVLEESMDTYAAYFRGFEAAKASRVALAYSRSVEGAQTGRVYRVG
ncbi:short chain dehydrogenase [Janthinobacterium fluminis]|uniref:Short chain dehydrogenase n=1 Tax=Janthinobacterium fluminis TaxID=2987524 RepID=A0ABT5K218_9BURK|nr:short chain dehydrogenase [Janthinobacterium fluminis]MDC8759018.1 short chain dehydrogenase [Janthinobacterium fluminis]